MKFTIEGVRHVAEYLQHRPQIVDAVHCPPQLFEQLQALAGNAVSVRAQKGSAVKAAIRLTPLHESELFACVRAGKLGNTAVALDHVVDPRNLGAVARSAAFFGVRGLIIPQRRQVGLTAAVVNAARGGFALLDLFLVTNLARTLAKLKEHDFWVIGADMQGERLRECDFTKRILLFGAEDKGLSRAVRAQCDCLLHIAGGARALQSLNVSAAAAIFLYQHSRIGGLSS